MTDTTPRSDSAYLPGERAPLRSPHGVSWVLFAGIMVFLAGPHARRYTPVQDVAAHWTMGTSDRPEDRRQS
jgi:hypothetical protein